MHLLSSEAQDTTLQSTAAVRQAHHHCKIRAALHSNAAHSSSSALSWAAACLYQQTSDPCLARIPAHRRPQGPLAELFDQQQLLYDVSGAGNNWAHGHHGYGPQYREPLCEQLRRAAEDADSLQVRTQAQAHAEQPWPLSLSCKPCSPALAAQPMVRASALAGDGLTQSRVPPQGTILSMRHVVHATAARMVLLC